jgi:predicted nucleic acid-binding protein
MNNILIDTGFWYALYNEREKEYYNKAHELLDYLSLGNIIIPFPSLYETINTRFSKHIRGLEDFKRIIERNNAKLIDDSSYKSDALKLVFESSLLLKRPLSLVDLIIRLMLSDEKLDINYLISFNPKDFIDVCLKRRIQILSD